ncbi:hypothetical protein GJU43_03580 [Flavobacterium sp. LC2016-23]|uniref:hypothetical protein n=1 Tax=Flavobacterium sp. LC2016-23 TaxID=2666330 RepID=UPI0012B04A81|nr:hypothetical protein [Flavobacterium sp. LC2016-23]MRX38342.1 hypothetical protein [Flavobacterium sp. LC2016-23]
MNSAKNILRVIFEGFNTKNQNYNNCILMIDESDFSRLKLYTIISNKGYLVSSEIKIDKLIRSLCEDVGGDLWEAYITAEHDGYSFTSFSEASFSNLYYHNIPRFNESDFETIICQLGGSKIPERATMTPDFMLGDLVIELKDLQKESLYNEERRNTITKIFEEDNGISVNINFSAASGEVKTAYKRVIANSIKNAVGKASKQIKEYRKINSVNMGGVFLINTGYFSLEHNLFKAIVEEIIARDTTTINFVYIFTQSVFHNAIGDLRADYKQDCIGDLPSKLAGIYDACNMLVDIKMSSIFQLDNVESSFAAPQYPISFFADNKIFYWKPERIEPSINFN